ncbi:hypothetical protein E1B28_000379 [Marasmius oreades]|uniref:Uncharacterized protein n=1 Tax=Marasmius oreades TaxID=181124 RepID=A0A9P8AEA3_9AGAR|nr:uncharacterized protein E1B28_000379 [Marasmius oreades]KAG7098427.1 hypothetical protein E1B28_000379 [Marasmius oreades]
MRFPLLRRLSHLIHRRPKSESFATDVLKQLAEVLANEDESLPRSQSLDDATEKRDPSILPPHYFDLPPQSPLSSSINDLLIVLSNLERRIPLLEDANALLKQDMERLVFESQLREQEINLKEAQAVRQSYLSQIHHEPQQIQMQQDQTRLENIALEDFLIKTLASYPADHVFNKIAAAIDAGSSFASAIVTVIREEIETLPNSPWSKLVPAIVGPRSADQYTSALGIVLKARKDLRNSQKASHFWKQQAKLDDVNADVITPSSSILSDIQEPLSEERQRAASDLLRKLRSGEIPIRSQVVTQAAPVEADPQEKTSSSPSVSLQMFGSVTPLTGSTVESSLKDVSEPVFTSTAVGVKPGVPCFGREEYKDSTAVVNTPNPMLPSSTTRSLATAVSISTVSSSSVSSFASTDLPEIWELVTPASLTPKITENVFNTRSRDAQDIGSSPIPPPRPPRPIPRISPFSGLETIDEADEPASRSSSSNYVSSLTSTSSNEAVPEDTTVDLSTQSDLINVIVDEAKPPVQQTGPPYESPANLVQSLVSPSAQGTESSIKPKSPMMVAMSRLPRRLSLSLTKSGKEKEKNKEDERAKENSGKGKTKDSEKPSTAAQPTTIPRRLQQSKSVLAVRTNTLVPSATLIPPPLKKSSIPPPDQVKPKSRPRSNSGASARPTISSALKHASTTPRKLNKSDKENMSVSGRGVSPTKPRMKTKTEGSMDRLGGHVKLGRVVRRRVV